MDRVESAHKTFCHYTKLTPCENTGPMSYMVHIFGNLDTTVSVIIDCSNNSLNHYAFIISTLPK